MPSGSSPQNSQTNFVDLHLSICNFKTHENFSKVYIIRMTEEQYNFFNLLQNFHAKRQGGGG
jgi:hypothetical protein